MRRLAIVLLSLAICLIGVIPALAQKYPEGPFKTEDFVYATLEKYERATGKKITRFNESPMLRTKVAAGEIPPVKERLPEEPLVIEPVEKIGKYGGTMHTVSVGPMGWSADADVRPGRILRMNESCTKALPALAKGYELSEDCKTFTLYLRKGVKWSDGHPFTVDDILFWWEDEILNDEITPVKPKMWMPGGKPAEFEKIDDYTLRIHFAVPNPGIIMLLAGWSGIQGGFFDPKHYLKKWHIKYNPEANKLAKEEGFDNWWEVFGFHKTVGPKERDPDLPVLGPWELEEWTPAYQLFVRNPYYYAIDTNGNQLPYIDKIRRGIVSDVETAKMKVMTGEFDCAVRAVTLEDYPLLKENEEKGGYRTVLIKFIDTSQVTLIPNQNYKDPILRKIFQDIRFRRAMSLAINREEINNEVFFGKGTPMQSTVHPLCTFYKKEWGENHPYIRYDPEKANRLLDEMGLKWDKNHEYRLRPDGKTLTVIIEFVLRGWYKSVLELVREYWEAVGVKTELKPIEWSLFGVRRDTGEHQVTVWHTDEVMEGSLQARGSLAGGENGFAPKWWTWWQTGGEAGEEPPEDVKQFFEWFFVDWKRCIPGTPRYMELAEKIWDWWAKNLWVIGTVGLVPRIAVLKDLRNAPIQGMPWGWDNQCLVPYLMEQWYLER